MSETDRTKEHREVAEKVAKAMTDEAQRKAEKRVRLLTALMKRATGNKKESSDG